MTTEPAPPRGRMPAGVPVPTSGPRALDSLAGRRFAITDTERCTLTEHAAFYCRLPAVQRRDRYDYPKRVSWHYGNAALERFWCLEDRPCTAACGWSIAAHTFYVRVTDYAAPPAITTPRLRVPATFDYHPACVPDRLAPALARLEVP